MGLLSQYAGVNQRKQKPYFNDNPSDKPTNGPQKIIKPYFDDNPSPEPLYPSGGSRQGMSAKVPAKNTQVNKAVPVTKTASKTMQKPKTTTTAKGKR